MKSWKISLLAVALSISMFSAGYALSTITHTIQTSVTVILRYGGGPVRAYSDPSDTIPILTLSFGNVRQGDYSWKEFYLRNDNSTYYVKANVTLGATIASGDKIVDDLGKYYPDYYYHYLVCCQPFPSEGYDLGPGETLRVRYTITIAADAPTGPYSWQVSFYALT